MRQTAIQLWTKDDEQYIILCRSGHQRDELINHIKKNATNLIEPSIDEVAYLWTHKFISNTVYLTFLNHCASRSLQDLSQYPIFPWVIADYASPTLDYKRDRTMRDLSKPIGAINKHRLQRLKDLAQIKPLPKPKNTQTNNPNSTNNQILTKDSKQKTELRNTANIYGTPYSSPSIVSFYLLRRIPSLIVRLQSSIFKTSGNVMIGIRESYYHSMNARADFKQLIPQFYSGDTAYLENKHKVELGPDQDGIPCRDVELPQWAHSLEDFSSKMKDAIESEQVSANLHKWIDLVFGYQQRGLEAVKANNLFDPLTYEGTIDWDDPQLTDCQKAAFQTIITHFGQIPEQLFTNPHPVRKAGLPTQQLLANINPSLLEYLSKAKVIALPNQCKNGSVTPIVSMQVIVSSKSIKIKEIGGGSKTQLLQRSAISKNQTMHKIKLAMDSITQSSVSRERSRLENELDYISQQAHKINEALQVIKSTGIIKAQSQEENSNSTQNEDAKRDNTH